MTKVPKEELTIQTLIQSPLERLSLSPWPMSRRNLVCTWSVLLDVRQRKPQGVLFDGDGHRCKAGRSNLTAGLLRGKLVPRGREFWRRGRDSGES